MPTTTTVSLGDLVEETLDSLYRSAERPTQLVVGSDALDNDSDTQFTLSLGSVNITDRVEGPAGELMLVTAKSADATPVYTVSRAYQNTTKADQATGTVFLKNPPFTRSQVTRWIQRGVSSLMNAELPHWETAEYTRHADFQYIELPADTLQVLRVRYFGLLEGRFSDVGGWEFQEVPTSLVTSGLVLRVSAVITVDDDLIVDVQRPYAWTGSGEAATVPLPVAAQDIPVLFASAYGQSRREISRGELDKIEEWNQDQAIRAGVNLRMIRDMWGEVYRRVDEAKKIHRLPKTRPFNKMPKVW
ncbi:hypothetical protein LCGC14_2492600 [marine sediment metagenome]|uniref:Uncharacterized protein n=1 Tax=marine sediment metagenome TaxID=412755 RepID=A0A0F9DY48_9ZZZZ